MNKFILFCVIGFLVFVSIQAFAFNIAGNDDDVVKPISFNVSMFKPADDIIRRSVIRSFLTRSWAIEEVGKSFVRGVNKNTVVEVTFTDAGDVEIRHVSGGRSLPAVKKWVKNLKKDMLVELTFCGNL